MENEIDQLEEYNTAVDIVRTEGKAAASLLQRKLRIGYMGAARLLDMMEENGVIGPQNGAKPTEVL
jgi:S-DNA-T family DNA segregation ATPase FtsK/SpoIIIE